MSCDVMMRFNRKESRLIPISMTGTGIDFTLGTYTAYAVENLEDLKKPFDKNEDYLFVIDDEELRAVSDLANGILNIPLTQERLDLEKDFYLGVIIDIDTYTRKKVFIKFTLDYDCIN